MEQLSKAIHQMMRPGKTAEARESRVKASTTKASEPFLSSIGSLEGLATIGLVLRRVLHGTEVCGV